MNSARIPPSPLLPISGKSRNFDARRVKRSQHPVFPPLDFGISATVSKIDLIQTQLRQVTLLQCDTSCVIASKRRIYARRTLEANLINLSLLKYDE